MQWLWHVHAMVAVHIFGASAAHRSLQCNYYMDIILLYGLMCNQNKWLSLASLYGNMPHLSKTLNFSLISLSLCFAYLC